jgi:hypothetical protein
VRLQLSFETPVALLIFNRSDVTRRVFDAIRQVRPKQLFVVGDGDRKNRPGEQTQVTATRSIVDNVDWPCDVQTCFSDTNLGCKRRVPSGLARLFEQIEDAIILEDDCLPDPKFFSLLPNSAGSSSRRPKSCGNQRRQLSGRIQTDTPQR